MYNDRTLSTAEALFVSRAQQKIAELGVTTARQYERNDVDEFNLQLMRELDYAICTLKSTFLDWTEDQIQTMMDYYTLHGNLVPFAFRSIIFRPLCTLAGQGNWATVEQLNNVEYTLNQYDQYLLTLINQLDIDYQAGDTILQLQIDNLTAGNNTLVADLTADISIGGIIEGTVFPAGTAFEDIWIALLSAPAVVTDFTFDSYTEVIETGVNLTISQFTWTAQGTPQNLVLNDSKGLLTDVPVAGGVHNVSLGYNWSVNEDLTWTLSADNMEDVTITVKRRYPTYTGSEATATDALPTITEAKVLAGTKSLQETVTEANVAVAVPVGSQGFIAVAKTQTGGDYTKWFVDNTNFSTIVAGEFIRPPFDLAVNGVTDSVYQWGYRSPLTATLKLHR